VNVWFDGVVVGWPQGGGLVDHFQGTNTHFHGGAMGSPSNSLIDPLHTHRSIRARD
jgi:hypothetical protein